MRMDIYLDLDFSEISVDTFLLEALTNNSKLGIVATSYFEVGETSAMKYLSMILKDQ